MTVLICGSRDVADVEAVRRIVERYLERSKVSRVLVGGAAGVDEIARGVAERRGVPVTTRRPEYQRSRENGWSLRVAPKRRNLVMVSECGRVLAIWDGRSSGTKHVIDVARLTGIPVDVARIGG